MFLLRAGEHIGDMKTFVKAFIKGSDIGRCDHASSFSLYSALF